MRDQKRVERIYLDEARAASSVFPNGEPVPHEPLDFPFAQRSGTLGIEITERCRQCLPELRLRRVDVGSACVVVLGGGVNAVYQASRRVLSPRWVLMAVVTLIAAAALAAGMIFLRPGR